MASNPISMTDVTRPNGVEGTMIYEDRVLDADTISQVYIHIKYLLDDVEVDKRKLTLGDGMIARAVDSAYNAALSEEIAAQKSEHPEYTDEEATDAARLVVTKANAVTIWQQLKNILATVDVVAQKTAHPEYSDEQAMDAALAEVADTVVQTLLAKNAGAQSWGVRLLKYAYNGKGL